MEHKLREVIISVTNRCNLRCAMCHIPRNPIPEMTTDELKALIVDAASLAPNSIVFSGGEPLLRGDIFELLKFVQQQKINTCLTSNGTLIDDAVAEKLAACSAGVVNISIEGPRSVHDALRGKGNFAKAVRALECLARHKIEATIATIVCGQNFKTLPYVLDLAHKHGATTVKFQPFSGIFLSTKEAGKKFFLPAQAAPAVSAVIAKIIQRARSYNIATNPAGYLYQIPAYLCGASADYSGTDCAAVWSSCPISSEGDIHLCWVLADKVIGNARKDRLSSVWGAPRHDRMRRDLPGHGCRGCLMSCYDYNFAKFDLTEFITTKAQKLKKPKFYRRQYFRVYQYVRYLGGKITRRIADAMPFRKKDAAAKRKGAIQDVQAAKGIFKEKLDSLK